MRSGYLIFLAAALGVSAGPTTTITTAKQWAQCGSEVEAVQKTCEDGFVCHKVNPKYYQCVPPPYAGAGSHKRGIDANSVPGEAPSANIQKRQTGNTPVRGAQSRNGSCYHRYKIQDLQSSHAAQFNMLILALNDLQRQPENSDVSWFGIGGIHGAPYIPWQQPSNGNFNQGMGYCVHGGPLFIPWHRPYILLIEQTLQARAVAIAARFTGNEAAAYQTAADQLRLPYWDWSDPKTQSNIPDIVMQPRISVTQPGNGGTPQAVTIQNPLFSYNFQSRDTLARYFSGNYANWMYTTRNPTSNSDPTPRNSQASTAMQQGYLTRRQQTYSLFSLTSFNSMAGQLEGIHNSVHTIVGGSNPLGHMSVVTVAAFDPIFWLHHTNVDRLSALYQAIYPANRLTPSPARATFGRLVPGTDGPNDDLFTSLYPFKFASGAWWNANEIKSVGTIWKYHYGYPEIPCSYYNTATADQISSNARSNVNQLYSSNAGAKKARRSPDALANALADPKLIPHQPGYTPGKNKPIQVRNEYTIRCVIDHSEIPGSWTGHILLTPQPCGKVAPGDYFLSKDRIAGFSSFGAPLVRKESMPYSQEYPITDNLIARNVKINDVSETEKYLKDNLKVCFTTGGDTLYEVPASSLKTWKLGVYRQDAKYPVDLKDGNILPTYGDRQYLPKVTKLMPGGITTLVDIYFPTMLDGRTEDLEGDADSY